MAKLIFSVAKADPGPHPLVFAPPRLDAQGFQATRFGAPEVAHFAAGFCGTVVSIASIPLDAGGFSPTAFGGGVGSIHYSASGFSAIAFGVARNQPIAMGFKPTRFSVPSTPLPATALAPATAFGAPEGNLYQVALGFQATRFGAAQLQPHAVGFRPTKFGANVVGQQLWYAASIRQGALSVVSPAYCAINVEADATGLAATRFGAPSVQLADHPHAGVVSQAFGFRPVRFGAARAEWAQGVSAQGFLSGAIGAPGATSWMVAGGFRQTLFGAPLVGAGGRAVGAVGTRYGTPALEYGAWQAPSAPRSRFGVPMASEPGAHRAYGIDRTRRFGRPSATARINRSASGFCGTRFGGPHDGLDRAQYARSLPPGARFGSHLLVRSGAC